jgi:hypothetical protein
LGSSPPGEKVRALHGRLGPADTALLLDGSGRISRRTVIYDSYQFSSARYHALASLNAEM